MALFVGNFSPAVRHDYRIGLPRSGRWREAVNTDSSYYGGSGVGNMGGVDAEAIGWHGQHVLGRGHAAAAGRAVADPGGPTTSPRRSRRPEGDGQEAAAKAKARRSEARPKT